MPDFDRLGGAMAFDGMDVRSARPTLRFRVPERILAFRWQLRQDGNLVGRGRVSGIPAGERRFEITPDEPLRRTNQPAKLRHDVLYPPFETHFPPTAAPSPHTRVRYRAQTGTNHDNDDNRFAVDFNFRSDDADRGHWVLAVAKGKVDAIVANNGEVHIVHEGFGAAGRFETWYAHMRPVKVHVGDQVDPLQRIGRLGDKYHGNPQETISPHLHHQHRRDGKGVKMELFMRGTMRNVEVSRANPTATEVWSQKVSGWDRPTGLARARFIVRVRRASDGEWSQANRLLFTVAARDAEIVAPPQVEQRRAGRTDIAHRYDGRSQEPGSYSLRYRVRDDSGTISDWAFDHTLVIQPVFD